MHAILVMVQWQRVFTVATQSMVQWTLHVLKSAQLPFS